MTDETSAALVRLDTAISTAPDAELPDLLGRLECIRTKAWARLCRPAPQPAEDRLLKVGESADRLGVSKDYLYRNAHRLPFTVRQGRALRFSLVGLNLYLRGRQGRAAVS